MATRADRWHGASAVPRSPKKDSKKEQKKTTEKKTKNKIKEKNPKAKSGPSADRLNPTTG